MSATGNTDKKEVRVWTDGCYDFLHHGHYNALRQARLLGDRLVVGIHSDEEIAKHKGPPVMNQDERREALEGCRFVDEVVTDCPWVTELPVVDKHNCDFVAHGDDIVQSADGTDCYAYAREAGRFRTFPRTEGVSTTNLVGRMLLLTKEHHTKEEEAAAAKSEVEGTAERPAKKAKSPYTGMHFLATSKLITLFSPGKTPTKDDKIVYLAGSFDLFHAGHIRILKKARELGTFLLVGIHDDSTVNQVKGSNSPIMNLLERTVCVLSCKYVDDVIIGAPFVVTESLIDSMNISVVVHGSDATFKDLPDPFAAAKKRGIFQVIESGSNLNSNVIVTRILENREKYEKRNRDKEAREVGYI